MTKRLSLTLVLLTVILTACGTDAPPAPTVDPNAISTQAFATVFAAQTATAVASLPTETPAPSPTPTYSGPPPELPPVFQTDGLQPGATPHTYITDACEYLKDRWDPNKSAPGTVVMVIMFHSIEKGTQTATDPKNIGAGDFKKLMKNLHDMGFQAINATQLADFLDSNVKIPPRSVVLIQDDRHAASNFNDWFRPYWEQWGWPVVNAWISALGGTDPVLAENIALEKEGWVDHEAHGVVHNIPMSDSSTDEYLRGELQGSIDVFQQYYGKTPIAIIWPGGGFGLRPVQMARQLGYRIGFTINPRGPIMFNWIPQADQPTGQMDIAEGPAGDPRLTLPRFWDTDALTKLDTIRVIGGQAAAYAEQNKATELLYYDLVCAPTLGPIPTAVP